MGYGRECLVWVLVGDGIRGRTSVFEVAMDKTDGVYPCGAAELGPEPAGGGFCVGGPGCWC